MFWVTVQPYYVYLWHDLTCRLWKWFSYITRNSHWLGLNSQIQTLKKLPEDEEELDTDLIASMPCTNLIGSGGRTTPDIMSGFHLLEFDKSSKKLRTRLFYGWKHIKAANNCYYYFLARTDVQLSSYHFERTKNDLKVWWT